jgi:hypothetical protein
MFYFNPPTFQPDPIRISVQTPLPHPVQKTKGKAQGWQIVSFVFWD